MNSKKLSISALFLCMPLSLLMAQNTKDTLKGEKKIDEVRIIGNTKKSTEANIIQAQKKSVEVIERVGSAQLSKQGVGDIATAVTKATGTQKDDATGMIVVRGMGDRNNSTTMNGLLIPSNDPENRNIDLGIFTTNMIDYLSIEKTYNPKMVGNMGGANVDVASRFHTGKDFFSVTMGSSINTSVVNLDRFEIQDGTNYFGTNIQKKPSQGNTAYRFGTSWNSNDVMTPINSSLKLDFGHTLNLGQGKLSIYGYAGFDNDYYYSKGISRTYPYLNVPTKDFSYDKFNYQTNSTGLLNVNYKINNNHRIFAIANYIHYTDQNVKNYTGFYNDILNDASQGYVLVRRGEVKSTDLFIGQLGGDSRLSNKLKLFWNLGYNRMNSVRPDRQQNIARYIYDTGLYSFSNNSTGDNNRYFDDLTQLDYQGHAHLDYQWNDKLKLTVGSNVLYRDNSFSATQYNFKPNFDYNIYINPSDYDAFFNQSNFAANLFSIITFRGTVTNPNALLPATYDSKEQFLSGYINVDYKFSNRFVTQLGVRYENIDQKMNFDVPIQTFGNNKNSKYNKVLPALNMKYEINDRQNLRFSASKTYTLPILKETAPFSYEDVDRVTFGNPYLYPSDNYNGDLKWEFFPKSGEIISVTAFGKYIQNPISRAFLFSAANTESFLNIGDKGQVFGLEVEARKDIYNFGSSRIYAFANASYLNSKQDISNEKVAQETNQNLFTNFKVTDSHLQGASDFLANFNLGYNKTWNDKKSSLDFVMSYAYVGESLYSVGYANMGNTYSLPLNVLDANFKFKFANGIGVGINGKNLLDPKFKREQRNDEETLTVEEYKKGRRIGLSVSYDF